MNAHLAESGDCGLLPDEDASLIEADNARWDALLATEEAQATLDRLAAEAMAEHRAGRTVLMVFSHQKRIVPLRV